MDGPVLVLKIYFFCALQNKKTRGEKLHEIGRAAIVFEAATVV
jgi:hypothetical protein